MQITMVALGGAYDKKQILFSCVSGVNVLTPY